MTRQLLFQQAESPVRETWTWKTNVIASVTNDEQRIAIRDYPFEDISLTYRFGADGQMALNGVSSQLSGHRSIVRSIRQLIECRDEIEVPMWQWADSIVSASWDTPTTVLTINLANPSPFTALFNDYLLVRTRTQGWYLAQLTNYDPETGAGEIRFATATGLLAAEFVGIVPIRSGILTEASRSVLERAADVDTVEISFTLSRSSSRDTVDVLEGELQTESWSNVTNVLNLRNVSDSLELAIEHGTERIDTAASFPYYVTHWNEARFSANVADSFNRYNRHDPRMAYWRAFLQNCKGSRLPFWFCSRRGEFRIVSQLDSVGLVLEGREFFDLWNATNLHALCVDDGDSIRVLRVDDVELISGNTSVLFNASFAPLGDIAQVSLAFPMRIKGDSVQFEHLARMTSVSFECESVQQTYAELELPEPIFEFRADSLLNTVTDGELTEAENLGSEGGVFTTPDANPTIVNWSGRRAALFDSDQYLRSDESIRANTNDTLTIALRWEATLSDATDARILGTVSGMYLEARSDGSLRLGRGTRVTTSAAGLIEVGARYSIELVCTPGIDRIYLDGVLVASSSATGSALADSLLRLGWHTGASARGKLPHVRIYEANLTPVQRAFVRAELLELWPAPSPLLIGIDGSDEEATFETFGETIAYKSIPIRGEVGGVAEFGFGVGPLRQYSNGIFGPLANGLFGFESDTPYERFSFLWNGMQSYRIAFAAIVHSVAASEYEFVDSSSGLGSKLTIGFDFANARLFVEFANEGVATRFDSDSFELEGQFAVFEIVFDSSDGSIEMLRNDVSIGSFTHSGFGEDDQDYPFYFISGDSYAILEFLVRSDFAESQYEYLRDKWQGSAGYMLTDLDDYLLLGPEDELLEV